MNKAQLKGIQVQRHGYIKEIIATRNNDITAQFIGFVEIMKGKLIQSYGDAKQYIKVRGMLQK